MTWRLELSTQYPNSISCNGPRRYTQQDPRHKSNQSAYQLLAFKKSIKRKVSQYTILKDEKYFEAFKRNLLVTATTHDCEEILDGNYKPDNTQINNNMTQQSTTKWQPTTTQQPQHKNNTDNNHNTRTTTQNYLTNKITPI